MASTDDVYAGRINGSGTAPWTSDGVVLSDKPGNPVGVERGPRRVRRRGRDVGTTCARRPTSTRGGSYNSGVPMWTDDGVRVVLAIDDQ